MGETRSTTFDREQGARFDGRATHFCLYAPHATRVQLCLYLDATNELTRVDAERRGDCWGISLDGVGPGQRYGYRVDGPYRPAAGLRFNPHKLLIDPYARALDRPLRWDPRMQGASDGDGADVARDEQDSGGVVPLSVVVDPAFDWRDDRPPRHAMGDSVIYECHVKGLTQRCSGVPEGLRGTYLGLAHAAVIDHLKQLGVTTVELLPVHASLSEQHVVERGLTNYWGYNTIAFFAPDPRFAHDPSPGAAVTEFQTMVRALHAADIEVILDVVHNHTGEGDARGPTLSMRGIDNAAYYRLAPDQPQRYVDTTGCGNSLHAQHAQGTRLVLDSLRYWVEHMHVDGFRVDLAPSLGRTEHGLSLREGLFAAIAQDPTLQRVKWIAEPWDVGPDGHRTGGFGHGWSEWNDRYRDQVRRFWLGMGERVGHLATRLAGSVDLFGGRSTEASVNYITSHDGFSLRDVVSYARRHNEANGWRGEDGNANEPSAGFGIEGPCDNPTICEIRDRVARSMVATLACSRGVPLLRQGDELGNTQLGNNNAYAQDNTVSWMDWGLDMRSERQLAFVKEALSLRRSEPMLRSHLHLSGELGDGAFDVRWLRPDGAPMHGSAWDEPGYNTLGMWLAADPSGSLDGSLLVWVNGGAHPCQVTLPSPRPARVAVALDSSLQHAVGTRVDADHMQLPGHTLLVLRMTTPRPQPRAGNERAALRALAAQEGIAAEHWTLDGVRHRVDDDTRVQLLCAMGLDAQLPSAWPRLLDEARAAEAQRAIEPVVVALEGSDRARRLLLSAGALPAGAHSYALRVTTEDGATTVSEGPLARERSGVTLRLPELARGVHQITLDVGNRTLSQRLIIAPTSAHCLRGSDGEPARGYGITSHFYALHRGGGWGIGDLGELRALIDRAAPYDADLLGMQPLHAADNEAPIVSPYDPISRRFRNPIYIDLTQVPELAHSAQAQRLLQSSEHARWIAAQAGRTRVDYAATWRHKREALRTLFATFQRALAAEPNGERAKDYARYVSDQAAALQRFATFCAIGERHVDGVRVGLDARRFEPALRAADSAAVAQLGHALRDDVDFQLWLQYELDRQLALVQAHAKRSGMRVGLYGDLAVGISPGGSDVWSAPQLFAKGVSLGAPPDAFAVDGQRWGLAPMSPRALRELGYAPFIELCRAAMRHTGMVRIDHVMGLLRQFWVPDGEHVSRGAYVSFPFESLAAIIALESHRAQTMVVGEDLGTVPEGLRDRMRHWSLLRSQVLYFERDPHGGYLGGHDYAQASLATVQTHDLPPLRGFWNGFDLIQRRQLGALDEASLPQAQHERETARHALVARLIDDGYLAANELSPSVERLREAVHRLLLGSRASWVGVSVDDLCNEEEALNTPGVANPEHPSWTRRCRLSMEAIAQDGDVTQLLALCQQLRPRAPTS